jgi:small subunit ribosomal protein S2
MQLTIEELLKAGVHFGHPTSRWNPNFKPFVAMKKNGIHIIDLEETNKQLQIATREITRIVKAGGIVLFVGTKKQAQDAVQQNADRCGMYYVVERWLGGTLTNFSTIKKSIKRLLMLEKESSDVYENLTKKEIGLLERERIKLSDLHRGIKDMKHLPQAIFFVDANHEATSIREAKRLGIPAFGLVDSNTDPTGIDFPIPANDDSLRSINLLVSFIADRIIEAKGGVVGNEKNETEIADKEVVVKNSTSEVIEEVKEDTEKK